MDKANGYMVYVQIRNFFLYFFMLCYDVIRLQFIGMQFSLNV